MTNDQKEALKKIFSLYENIEYKRKTERYIEIIFAKDELIAEIPELAKVFPVISLENDKMGIFKRIYFKKKVKDDKHLALLNNCVDNDEVILHKREIEGVKG